MKENLIEQLNLCIVTCSSNIILNSVPLTFKPFCPDLSKEETKITDSGDKKRILIKLMVRVIIKAIATTINTRITRITTIIIVMGTVIIATTIEIITKRAL